jgi:hypothetical protein
VLFDQGTPVPLRAALVGLEVETAFELGWASLENGALLAQAASAGFNVLVTTDQNLKYQQNLASRKIAIVVVMSTSWPRIRAVAPDIDEAVRSAVAGSYVVGCLPIQPSQQRSADAPTDRQ